MCHESMHDFIELLETKNSLKLKKNPSKNIFQLFIELLFLPMNAYTHNCFMAIDELKFQGCCVLGLGSKVCNVIM
jgi:hypothetical protein